MKHFARNSRALAIALFLSVAFAAGAQETGVGQAAEMDLDALFGDEVVEEATALPSTGANPATKPMSPVTSALTSEAVRIGGSFSGSLSPSATWTDLWGGGSPILDPDDTSLGLSLKSTLYFDARPSEEFRVHGSAKTAWPFSATKTFLTSTTTNDSITAPNISVFELFADFSLNDEMYFRFGKSTVKWGVGYFWSPADVINIESINVLDADAQREGPVNMRVNIPVFGTQNNFYLYTIFDKVTVDFETTALAAKAEVLLGNYELGLGGYYRYDTAERAMLTLTGPAGDFDIFGEAMVSRGSAKTFITGIDSLPPFTVHKNSLAENRETFYFSASAGFLYNNANENITAVGQYFYNGEGYSDDDRNSLIADAKASPYASSLAAFIYGSGRHYAAMNLSKGKVLGDDISASVIVLASLSDFSGFVKPSVSWRVADNFSLTLSPMFVFGEADDEYAILSGGDAVSLSLGATVSGSF